MATPTREEIFTEAKKRYPRKGYTRDAFIEGATFVCNYQKWRESGARVAD
ncbi:MAG: hypothetical protein IKN59_01770 [Paludibacteraceae bacterium]|nr:hypothetical protein [Paludibacteraceae bacterium]